MNVDILHSRIQTTEITTTRIKIKSQGLDVIDVGGHKSARCRWAPYLSDDLTSIFFVASLAGYDQKVAEDSSINRMVDSVQLFNAIRDNRLISNPEMSFVVFLNKKDLFGKKVKTSLIVTHFPNFEGIDLLKSKLMCFIGENSTKKGVHFFRRLFTLQDNDQRAIFHHVTQATDIKLMSKIIDTITYVYYMPTAYFYLDKLSSKMLSRLQE